MKNLFKWAFLLPVACQLTAAPVIAARTDKPPVLDGVITPAEWNHGRVDRKFAPMERNKPSEEQTDLYAMYDSENIYLALNCHRVPKDGTLKSVSVFSLPRLEIRLGDKEHFSTFALAVTGQRYPEDGSLQSAVAFHDSGWSAEIKIPLACLPQNPLSGRVYQGNIIRATGDGNSSLFPIQVRSFVAPDDFDDFFLGTSEKIVADRKAELKSMTGAEKYLNRIDAVSGKELIPALTGLMEIERLIDHDRNQIIAADLKAGKATNFVGSKAGEYRVADEWKPKDIKGKDFWFMMMPRGNFAQPGDFTDIPLYRESMLYIMLFSDRNDKKPLRPLERILNGEIQEAQRIALEKTSNPFILKTRTLPDDKEEAFGITKESIRQFIDKYQDRLVVLGAEECIGIRGYARTLEKAGIPVPKTKEEGYQSFLSFYRNIKTATARSWPVFYPELHPWRGSGSATYADHLFLSAGDVMSGHEISAEILDMPMQIAVSRGAARQYGKPWRTYIATHDKKLKFPGQAESADASYAINEFYESLTPHELRISGRINELNLSKSSARGPLVGVPYEDRLRQIYYTYLSGSNIITEEGGHRHTPSRYDYRTIDSVDPLVVNLRDKKWYLSRMGEDLAWMYDNIVKKHDRGTAYAPVALMWDLHHGYMPKYMSNIWDAIPPTEADRMMMALEHTIFPYSKKIYNDLAFRVSPFGDIFDVITNDASARTIDSYPAVFFCGDVPVDRALAEKLVSYVDNGGTLIINLKQLEPYLSLFPPDFLGAQPTGKNFQADRSYSYLSGELIVETGKFKYQEVKPSAGTTILAVSADERKSPLILSAARGKGKVILSTPEYLKIAWERRNMLKLFSNLMSHVSRELLPVKVEGDVEYLVSRNSKGWVVSFFNNYGVAPNRSWENPMPPADPQEAVKVTVIPKTPVKSASEWMTSEVMAPKDGKFELIVPAGGVRIVEFQEE